MKPKPKQRTPRQPTPAPVPDGCRDGITYTDGFVTMVLYCPGITTVYAVGSFSKWKLLSTYLCTHTPDGLRCWITLPIKTKTPLLFQWDIDSRTRVSDPYSEQVCDVHDKYISDTVYPDMPVYPIHETTGIITVLRVPQKPYQWNIQPFVKPSTTSMVVYEIFIRDVTHSGTYKGLLEILPRLSRLGINVIELMPIMEFEGNESWGYNVSHLLALDKVYGTPNACKEFIDECHKHGIAVVLDIVLNHQFGQSPLVNIWGNVTGPTEQNPYFNIIPKHPFNVGYDFNHESSATQYYIQRVLEYWVLEYHIDGFQFDLSKGVTQNDTGNDWAAMANYDPSRVAIWSKYKRHMHAIDPTTIMILEHFADEQEEHELSAMGFLLWANATKAGGNCLSAKPDQDIASGVYALGRGHHWHCLVGYIESHDEERTAYRALHEGTQTSSYNTRDITTMVQRMETTMALLLCVPGPKHLWQFNEVAYPISVNTNGRLGRKPSGMPYINDQKRFQLLENISALVKAHISMSPFSTYDCTPNTYNPLKTIVLRHEQGDVVIVANLDIVPAEIEIPFSRTGWWVEFVTGEETEISTMLNMAVLQPGTYRLYSTFRLR